MRDQRYICKLVEKRIAFIPVSVHGNFDIRTDNNEPSNGLFK